jgi:hypothetical protein
MVKVELGVRGSPASLTEDAGYAERTPTPQYYRAARPYDFTKRVSP